MKRFSSTISHLFFLSAMLFLFGCSSLIPPAASEKTASFHYGYQAESPLAHYFSQTQFDISQYTGFYPLEKGHDGLLARLALIESAQKSLDVQYYIYRDDETSQLLTWHLYSAAERGVRVRILLDDMQQRSDKGMAYLNQHPNIEIRLFNPYYNRTARGSHFLMDFDRLNHRMHNKSISADSVVSIVGGRNIGNEYFSYESSVEFGDFDVMLYGNTVAQTEDQFDQYWNSDMAVPLEWLVSNVKPLTSSDIDEWVANAQPDQKFTQGQYDIHQLPFYQKLISSKLPLYWGKGILLYDSPDKVAGQGKKLTDDLNTLLEGVDHSLVLISPYFVPTELGAQALAEAALSGKEITIITNSLASNDVFAVHGWYAKYRLTLIEAGIKLWEIRSTAKINSKWSLTGSSRSSLHAKAMMLDERKMFVGSMNWDPRSAKLNTEMAVVIEQPEYAQEFLKRLDIALKKNAYQVIIDEGDIVWLDHTTQQILTSEPDASVWRKIGAWFSGVLPIEDQL
ncbi:phospholipase D family protein [Vibrio aestuarianus]|uniref:phospholipase D family protein n=1 Tax=Vibrio aestuarianus TaxID=28171 RepID=UPI00237C96FD|nr:phospholipase D family protein [Vibrio aestuarianus]MDE1239779.1 phospholipase D family protein [Vibrio aestuarianus]